MIDELREIERELNRLRARIRRMINLLEKRRVRLSGLKDDEFIGEAAERTLPTSEIVKLLEPEKTKKKKKT